MLLAAGGVGVAAIADSSGGVDDAVPGDGALFGGVAEDFSDESGAAGQAGEASDVAVGGDVAGGDSLHDGEDVGGSVVGFGH